MKKQLGVILAAVMLAGTAAGCSSKPADSTTGAVTEASSEAEKDTAATEETKAPEAAGGRLKTGLAVVSTLDSSKDAKDGKEGNAQVDSVAAAVVLDSEGKIVDCLIDVAQNKMAFTPEGKVVMEEEFKTKRELGDEHNMKPASGIGKEWYEQADALEAYVIGKTADEVAGFAVDEDTKPTDADLAASVTVSIGDYVEAIVQASDNAKEIGTQPGDKLGLGIVTDMEEFSKDAKADADGQCQAYSTYAAVTIGADGKITGCAVDDTQGTIAFDAAGKITSDLTAGVTTKRQLGDEYGMKPASGIGKEWFEQADGFEKYVVGKTAEEVKGIAVNEDNKPTDADLTASVTMAIGDFQKAIEKALK